jgi:hypothetical protein
VLVEAVDAAVEGQMALPAVRGTGPLTELVEQVELEVDAVVVEAAPIFSSTYLIQAREELGEGST